MTQASSNNPIDPISDVVEDMHDDGRGPHDSEQLVPDLLARRFTSDPRSYWQIVWDDFKTHKLAMAGLIVMAILALVGIFAPLLANQRPFVMSVDGELSFPLFAFLKVQDFVLLLGLVQIIIGYVVYKRATKRDMAAGAVGVGLMLLLAFGSIIVGVIVAATDVDANGKSDLERLSDQSTLWITLTIGLALAGLALAVSAFIKLFRNKRDEFGKLQTGQSIIFAITGSTLLFAVAGNIITLGQKTIDNTRYDELAAADGNWAIFPPVQQDYIEAQSYMVNQPPGGPNARIQPSGGLKSAADLGLTDSRRETNLKEENNGQSITRETLLANLRSGSGVRITDQPRTSFVIIASSLDRYSVKLAGSKTIGDVIDKINVATAGDVTATINKAGTRLELIDNTPSKPKYYLGTDANGSDVAARLIRATRVALSIGFVSTGIAILIGITMGALMGYFGGWVDVLGMRIIEIFMAIPRLFLLLTIIAFIPAELNKYMLYAMMAVIGATSWMTSARFIRAEFFRLRNQDFVQAAQACGLPLRSILFKHMLPNGVTPVLVDVSFSIAAAILLETGLSFLGFGIKPPDPSWGQMLAGAVDTSTGVFRWWLAIFPGIMIFLTVFCFNVVGDALRDAIDPKLKKAAH